MSNTCEEIIQEAWNKGGRYAWKEPFAELAQACCRRSNFGTSSSIGSIGSISPFSLSIINSLKRRQRLLEALRCPLFQLSYYSASHNEASGCARRLREPPKPNFYAGLS